MRARHWLLYALAACGGGGDDTPQDAILDTPAPCSDVPGTRFMTSSAVTFGTLPSAGFTGQVCIEGTTNCVTPAPMTRGVFLMCVPATGGFGIELISPQFDDVVHLHGEGSINSGFAVADKVFAEGHLWTPAGAAAYPPTDKGLLIVQVAIDREPSFPIGIPDATFAISPAPARPVVYMNEDGDSEVALAATTDAGIGVVADVDPGMYDVTVTGPTACGLATGAGFESPVAGAAVRAPVIAGKTTAVTLYCTPP